MNLGMPRLCYVNERRHLAYFTTQDISQQMGDDWNDPLDNSGEPYDDYNNKDNPRWKVFYVTYDSTSLHGPDEEGRASRNNMSVDDINKGMKAPWLSSATDWSGRAVTPNTISLYAGTTIYEFINELEREGIAYGIPRAFKEYLGIPPAPQSPHAKCPGCGVDIEYVHMSAAMIVSLKDVKDSKFHAMFFMCPHCKVVLPGEMVHDHS